MGVQGDRIVTQKPNRTPDERVMRRAIPQRETGWARRIALAMQKLGLTPNIISVLSVVIAAIGTGAFVMVGFADDPWPRLGWLALAAICAPLRLLANMLDGMLAVECGMHSPVGDLYNEVPDRISDVLFLAGAGYALTEIHGADVLGWIAATLAVLTAYVRSLGAAQGLSNHFDGPMAKPRRMWVLVIGSVLSMIEIFLPLPAGWAWGIGLALALGIIALGSLATVVVRLRLIARDLRERAA